MRLFTFGKHMCGTDCPATVDCNPNLVKAVELVFSDGQDLITYTDALCGRLTPPNPARRKRATHARLPILNRFTMHLTQLRYVMERMVALYERSTALRAEYAPTPYVLPLPLCRARKGLHAWRRRAFCLSQLRARLQQRLTCCSQSVILFMIKACTMDTLIRALQVNWQGYELCRHRRRIACAEIWQRRHAADALAQG